MYTIKVEFTTIPGNMSIKKTLEESFYKLCYLSNEELVMEFEDKIIPNNKHDIRSALGNKNLFDTILIKYIQMGACIDDKTITFNTNKSQEDLYAAHSVEWEYLPERKVFQIHLKGSCSFVNEL